MLRLLFGPARSGKTEGLARLLGEGLRRSDRSALVLVPEQFSFETERAFLAVLGAEDMARVEVLSFTRLCEHVFRERGGYVSNALDAVGRSVAMDVVLHDCAGELEFYGRQVEYPAFQKELLLAIGNCKGSLVTPEKLMAAAEMQPEGAPLRGKLHDLGVLLAAFNAYVNQTCVDPEDNLARAAQRLEGADFFRAYDLYVDAFKDFTAAQESVLGYALAECGEVAVALCADAAYGSPLGLFAPTQRTSERLRQLAHRRSCKVATPIVLPGGGGYQSDEMRQLAAGLYQDKTPSPDVPGEVRVFSAPTRGDECTELAARIRRMIRTEGYRCRDIAVLTKDVSGYREPLTEAFRRYDLPLFCDERMDVLSTPPAALMQAVVRTALRLDTGAFLQIAKSGLFAADEDALCGLDDYCYTYDINGSRWLTEFTGNPDGLAGEMDEEQRSRLEAINALRLRLTEPIQTLRTAAAGACGDDLTRALYAVFDSYQAREHLETMVAALSEENEQRRLLPEAWNTLMDALDRLCLLLAGRPVTLERYASLLNTLLSSADYGIIPQTLDAVSLGAVDRARTSSPRAVFLVGVSDGEFPAPVGDAGLFSQTERPKLEEAGLPLMDDAASQLCDERFLAYAAVTSATERITFSWPSGDLRGEQKAASELVREALAVFPSLRVEESAPADSGLLAETRESGFAVLCAGHERRSGAHDDLFPLLAADPEFGPEVRGLDDAIRRPEYHLDGEGSALFSGQTQLSPSRVSSYYECRFSYFCRYGLEVRPRPKAQISVLETGSLVHFVLEKVVSGSRNKDFCELSDHDLEQLTAGLVNTFVREELGMTPADARTAYQLTRITTMCVLLVKRLAEEFRQSDFTPAATELSIGRDVPPLRLRSPGGAEVEVIGKVDRVDTMERDGKKYLRVVDYKTGTKEFRLADVREGLNMQMLLYLATLWQNGRKRFGETIPAGVLYMPAQTAVQNGDVRKLRMNGLLLDDPEVLQGMEHDLQGVFIPVKTLKNGGFSAESPLASLAQFGMLQRLIERRVTQMADGLMAGEIAALPIAGEYDRCQTCDYRAVCKREDQDPLYQPEEVGKDRVWDAIAEELETEPADGAEEKPE